MRQVLTCALASLVLAACGRVGFGPGDGSADAQPLEGGATDGGVEDAIASDASPDAPVPDATADSEAPDIGVADTGTGAVELALYAISVPHATGTVVSIVPSAGADLAIYANVGDVATIWDTPMPVAPVRTAEAGPGLPLVLRVPEGAEFCPMDCGSSGLCAACAELDHYLLVATTARAAIHVADDERVEAGTPDRLTFLTAFDGGRRGSAVFGNVKGTDPNERIHVYNPTEASQTATVSAWSGSSWEPQGMLVVPAGDVAIFPPTRTALHRVSAPGTVMAYVGYTADNGSMLAADIESGGLVGLTLLGHGDTFLLRAQQPLSFDVESQTSTGWTSIRTGTLLAGETVAQSRAVATPTPLRLVLSGGVGWALTGLPNALTTNEWTGDFLPDDGTDGCRIGATFHTTGPTRIHATLPTASTTISTYSESTGALLDEHTSAGAWEVHSFYTPTAARVHLSSPGAVMQLGSVNFGNCDEASLPGRCGMAEGGYSAPRLGTLICPAVTSRLDECSFVPDC